MKKILFVLCFAFLACCVYGGNVNPVANPESTVIYGNARFTVLTPRLIRMEWSENGTFEDRATLAVVNREMPLCKFTVSKSEKSISIVTKDVTLKYSGNGMFDANNLSVSFLLNGRRTVWHPGDAPSGNLRGTSRTLDRIGGRSDKTTLKYRRRNTNDVVWDPLELEDGIISRDGWAIVDESNRHVLEKNDSDWEEWVAERSDERRQDLYIFAYGHDYKAALADFTKIAGRIPLPPKYVFGYWWSRYWAYTDEELFSIAKEMRDRKVPMDVFIVDMDWHQTWKTLDKRSGMDEFGQRHGWTGYTWNGDLFPDPKGFLNELHTLKYKTALNLHPASGIQTYEEPYSRFVKDYLKRTEEYDGPKDFVYSSEPYVFKGNKKSYAKEGYSAPVPFRLCQQAWADAYFETVIHPLEGLGVDFWWLDWQQWRKSKYVKDLNNTFWCNWTFFNDKVRQGRRFGKSADRPFIYHRWGGLGTHRYPLGFSGDTYDEWSVLEMLPYFTATASNVGYGYWGHDIGGHMQLADHPTDPEMYTRWLQYGVFTPIFKTHSSLNPNMERKIWAYPTHYDYMKEAISLRYALSPYIYSYARTAYDTGVSICRPLYYEYPERSEAYSCDQEFFFGDNILATVLCQPAKDGKTERKMWFPAGNDWYDMAAHVMRRGGTSQTLYYTIDQNPWFVKAGSVIPLASAGIQDLQDKNDGLRLLIVPGNGASEFKLYEDDGKSQSYDEDYSWTRITKSGNSSKTVVTIYPREGRFDGASANRNVSVIVEGAKKLPKSASLDGKSISDFSLSENAAEIYLGPCSADEKHEIVILM